MEYLIFFALSFIAILIISLPLFKKLDAPLTNTKNRSNPIDGLRGYLAFAVVVNHFDSTLYSIKFHNWGTLHVFDRLLGEVGVALFFMITGYLFWGKLLASSGKTDWKKLYINRFFRIAPVYYAILIPVLLTVAVSTGFQQKVPSSELYYSVFKWMFVGIQHLTDINGFQMMPVLGVVWTLHYEWIFYFSLPFISYFIRIRQPLIFCLVGIVLSLIYLQFWHPSKASWPLFFSGMICATVKKTDWKIKNYPILGSVTALLSLFSVFFFFDTAIGIVQILLLFVFFFLITNGKSELLGLLSLRGSKRLGHISYSLYLTHMIVLYLFFNSPFIKNMVQKSDTQFWLLTIPCTLIVLIVSSLSYYFIEKGGIEIGKNIVNKLGNAESVKLNAGL